MKEVLSIVLAGGRGTRLFPLTKLRSKPAVPLGGKYRLVDVPISNCINSGLEKIFVLTQFNSASLNRHIGQTFKLDMFSDGFVEVLAAELTEARTEWFKGTADAVRQNLRHFDTWDVRDYLILSGDQLYRMNYAEMLERHRATCADITVCVVPVPAGEARSFGILALDPNRSIRGFVEKPRDLTGLDAFRIDPSLLKTATPGPDRADRYLASMGIYVFRAAVLEEILQDSRMIDFGKDILPTSIKRYRAFAFVFDGYWRDIGSIKSFYAANLDLTRDPPPFDFYSPEGPIYSHARFLPASRIINCTVSNSIISEGAVLAGSSILRCVVGVRSRIREGSIIEDTIIMGADYYENETPRGPKPPIGIGENCRIRRAIIDKNARIGDGVQILNAAEHQHLDGEGYSIREGIVVVEKNGVLRPGTVV